MRPLAYLAALVLPACTAQNPLFGLDPTEATGSSTASTTGTATTNVPTSQGPGSDPTAVTTTAVTTTVATTDGPTTANPSEPATTGHPPDTGVDPGTTTGSNPGTTTNASNDSDIGSSSGGNSSTGEMACMLTKNPEFDDHLRANGQLYQQCIASPTFFHGRLIASADELRFNTTNSGCVGEEKLGILSLGSNYTLPLANGSDCAKLWVYRDGDAPGCDIATFFVIEAETMLPLAIGVFSPKDPPKGPPASLLAPDSSLIPCCPPESQDCCDDAKFGDYALVVDGTKVLPGTTADVMAQGKPGRLTNIQNWVTGDCLNQSLLTRRDWAGVRL